MTTSGPPEGKPLDVPPGAVEMRFVPDGWDSGVRDACVGEDRFARCCVGTADDPLFAASVWRCPLVILESTPSRQAQGGGRSQNSAIVLFVRLL